LGTNATVAEVNNRTLLNTKRKRSQKS